MAADKKEKVIEVFDNSGMYSPKEQVDVLMQSSMGLQAVVVAFAIPLVLVMLTVFAGIGISGNEALGGILGIAALIPYYVVLYIFRDKLKKKFVFTLSKRECVY